jgi:hypothetical protein
MGFDLAYVSVRQARRRRSGVVVGKGGIEGSESLSLGAGGCCARGGKQGSAGMQIGAWVKQLFRA